MPKDESRSWLNLGRSKEACFSVFLLIVSDDRSVLSYHFMVSDDEQSREKSQIKRYQSDLFILEADRVREERRREDFADEVKRIKSTIDRLEVEKQMKETAVSVSEKKLDSLKIEITMLKKKMNGY